MGPRGSLPPTRGTLSIYCRGVHLTFHTRLGAFKKPPGILFLPGVHVLYQWVHFIRGQGRSRGPRGAFPSRGTISIHAEGYMSQRVRGVQDDLQYSAPSPTRGTLSYTEGTFSSSPTDVSLTKNSWMLHPLDKVAFKRTPGIISPT
jgi:hypothetical protein